MAFQVGRVFRTTHVKGFPNDLLVIAAAVGGFFVSGFLIHFAYSSVKDRNKKKVLPTLRVVQVCRFIGPAVTLLAIFLTSRVGMKINGSYFTAEAITKSFWVFLRAVIAFVVGANPFILELHPILRISELACIVLLVVFDASSEVYFAGQVDCIEQGVCTNLANESVWNLTYLLRDLISIHLEAILLCSLFWASINMGFTSNLITLPKKEHRYGISKHKLVGLLWS